MVAGARERRKETLLLRETRRRLRKGRLRGVVGWEEEEETGEKNRHDKKTEI